MIMNKMTQNETLFVGALKAAGANQSLIGLTFPGQIITFSVPLNVHSKPDNLMETKEPTFHVFSDNRAKNKIDLTQV